MPPPKRDGKHVCRNCDQIITAKRRTSYCSDACSEDFAVKYFPAIARDRVRLRDQGVCAICLIDTQALEKFMAEISWTFGYGSEQYRIRIDTWELPTQYSYNAGLRHLWEADHIVPYSEGGDKLGLDNLRTLCIWCHRERTRTWHGERARARRQAARRERRQGSAAEGRGAGPDQGQALV